MYLQSKENTKTHGIISNEVGFFFDYCPCHDHLLHNRCCGSRICCRATSLMIILVIRLRKPRLPKLASLVTSAAHEFSSFSLILRVGLCRVSILWSVYQTELITETNSLITKLNFLKSIKYQVILSLFIEVTGVVNRVDNFSVLSKVPKLKIYSLENC